MINWKDNTPPEAPYIASVFNYYLSDDLEGYSEYDELTLQLAYKMPGFLGYESFKANGRGSFISYWKDMDSVKNWAADTKHREAKELGIQRWYRYYHSIIAEVKSLRSHNLFS